jgi:hypothetical protein
MELLELFVYLVLTSLSSINETTNVTQHLTDISVYNLFTNEFHILKLIKILNEPLQNVSVHFGTFLPSAGRTQCQFLKHKSHSEAVMY